MKNNKWVYKKDAGIKDDQIKYIIVLLEFLLIQH